VHKQAEAGIDIVNDGEMGKPGYSTYVKDRLTGFKGQSRVLTAQGEAADFPEWNQRRIGGPQLQFSRPTCTGPIEWSDFDAVKRDIANLKDAASHVKVEEVFVSAASPGVIAIFLGNDYFQPGGVSRRPGQGDERRVRGDRQRRLRAATRLSRPGHEPAQPLCAPAD
jgi:5-methyltetrahydropteroyltriglutamate--homocysteine methyltransferase